MIEQGIFKRTELLVGKTVMDAIENASVIVFGVGGVGSWCVESLVRSGIRKITIVDSDAVCDKNRRQAKGGCVEATIAGDKSIGRH